MFLGVKSRVWRLCRSGEGRGLGVLSGNDGIVHDEINDPLSPSENLTKSNVPAEGGNFVETL